MGKDFEENIKELNDVNTTQGRAIEVLESIGSPEELAAVEEIIAEGSAEDSPDVESRGAEETTNADDKDPDEKDPDKTGADASVKDKEKPDASEDDTSSENTPPDTGKVSGREDIVTIDDDYIQSQPEEDRKILEQLKGEVFSEKGLNMAVNAQRLIGKKESQLKIYKDQEQADNSEASSPIPEKIPQQQFNDEIKNRILATVDAKLERDYPNLPPSGTDEYNEFLRDMNDENPVKFHEYLNARKSMETSVDKEFQTAIYVTTNYRSINKNQTEQAVTQIKERFKQYGFDDPKELGFNFDLEFDEKSNPKNDLITGLVFNGENYDTEVITDYNGVPIINSKGMVEKFFSPEVMNTMFTNIRNASVASGYKKASENAEKVDNSLAAKDATSSGPGKALSVEEIANIDDPELIDKLYKESNESF